MNILIIEDEPRTADSIIRLVKQYNPSFSVMEVIDSIITGIRWFTEKKEIPDLILADIQLTDGTCFDLFERVKVEIPVIFITAYNEYALDAFRLNSIDYLLKPVSFSDLKNAFDKFNKTKETWLKINSADLRHIFTSGDKNYKQRFLVKSASSYRILSIEDITGFISEDGVVFASLKNGKRSFVENSISELTQILDPERFFQANRSTIINIDSIIKISEYFNRRLIIQLLPDKQKVIISRERVRDFKNWLDK